ncbi:hypothetical protein C9413_22310 [Rhizobium sp. SEMIA 4085]|nr:hypothetical protein [Rhizobium gallicum]NNH32105.1 hypothetical protein [Rhizobium sp. SEMIA 4085]
MSVVTNTLRITLLYELHRDLCLKDVEVSAVAEAFYPCIRVAISVTVDTYWLYSGVPYERQ